MTSLVVKANQLQEEAPDTRAQLKNGEISENVKKGRGRQEMKKQLSGNQGQLHSATLEKFKG